MKRLILSVLLLSSSTLFAKAAIVLSITNTVKGSIGGATKTLQRGDALSAGDSINTSAGAIVRIKYTNGTLVSIAPNSSYKILAYAPNAEEEIEAELSKGTIVSKTNGQTKEALKTPVIAMAILGTEYATAVKGPKKTYIKVIKGSVKAGNRVLGPGDSVLATPDGIVNAVFPDASFTNQELHQLDEADASSDDLLSSDESDTGESDIGDDSDSDSDSGGDIADSDSGNDAGPEVIAEDINSSFVVGDTEEAELEDIEDLAALFP